MIHSKKLSYYNVNLQGDWLEGASHVLHFSLTVLFSSIATASCTVMGRGWSLGVTIWVVLPSLSPAVPLCSYSYYFLHFPSSTPSPSLSAISHFPSVGGKEVELVSGNNESHWWKSGFPLPSSPSLSCHHWKLLAIVCTHHSCFVISSYLLFNI